MGHIPSDDGPTNDAGGDNSDNTGDKKGVLNRRNVLSLGAAAIGSAALSGAGTVSGAVERYGIRFDRVVDAVDDLGMDPNGNDPIDGALDAAYETGTLVEFPPGDYLVTEFHSWSDGISRFGMVGAGSAHTDVQFVFPPGNNGEKFRMIKSTSGSHHVFANFSIQQTDDDRTSADMWIAHSDGTLIQDVEWLGRTPTDNYARRQLLAFDCTTQSGVNVGRRIYMRSGSVLPGYPDGVAGIRVGPSTDGEVRLVDCHIEQMGSSSFRATKPSGVLRVEGGLFKNNDNTNMRISGGNHPDKDAWVKDATVVVDADNLEQPTKSGDRLHGPEGLRVDSSDKGWEGVIIENCDFHFKSSPSSSGLVTCPTWGGHGGFTMRNCTIVNDTSVQTFNINAVDTNVADRPWGITLENCTVTGATDSQPEGAAISIDDNRDATTIVDSCIHFPNGDVDGVRIDNSDSCAIQNTNINVSGRATNFNGASVDTSGITHGETCSAGGSSDGGDGTAPTAPSNLSSPGNTETSVDLAWDGSTDDDSGVDHYTVYVDGSRDHQTPAGTTSTTVSELSSGTAHDFAVTAVDGAGNESDSSNEITVTTNDLPHAIQLEGTGTQTRYQFTVSGELEATGDIERWDSISGSSADGWITTAGATDTYNFSGELTDFTIVEGDATVSVDGEPYGSGGGGTDDTTAPTAPANLSSPDTTETAVDLTWNASSDDSGVDHYTVYVDGTKTQETAADTTTATVSNLDPDTSYDFHVTAVDGAGNESTASNTITVTTDAAASSLSRTITLEGTGTQTRYQFTVSGELEATDDIESWDSISGSSADGWITTAGATDTYNFSGELTDFTFVEGDATVYVDGEEVDPTVSKLPNTFVVQARTSGTTTYQLRVDDTIVADDEAGALESTDTIEGQQVSGEVSGDDVDAFRFKGDLVKMDVDGDASVSFEDNDG